MPNAEVDVTDHPEASRYEARVGDRVLGIVDYVLSATGDAINLVHTEVLPEAEGMGIGSRLARTALEDVRRRRLRLTVDCPFITAYLKRHPDDYADLTAARVPGDSPGSPPG
jgi:predicted GNAT family acetyltransferase